MVDALAVGGPTWAQMYAWHAHADRPAVVSATQTWTFRELTRDATGWACWLDWAGLPAGTTEIDPAEGATCGCTAT